MPNSLRCKIKHLYHNGTLTERERDRILEVLEQEPCEDAISREKARQFLYERLDRLNDDELYDIFSRIIDDMYNELPSVTPQPKTGRWIWTLEDWNKWECSECGFTKRTDIHVDIGYQYCPKCGCYMESEEVSQQLKTVKAIKMREATPEERESINKYIKSISKPTGVSFWNSEQEPCEEMISRADMLDAIGHGTTYTTDELQKIIKGLPTINLNS